MRLSFSTRGWEQPWEQLTDTASDMRFNGIELYNLHRREDLLRRGGAFHKYNTAATVRALREAELSLPCFDTSIDVSAQEADLAAVKGLLQLARSAECPCVAVFASRETEYIEQNVAALLEAAEKYRVTLLVKTTGVYADTAKLRLLLEGFASDRLAALWDLHHPYRDMGESADTTIKNLGAYVRHVHLRDSDDDGSYNLIGEGTLPLESMMRALYSIDYDGFISLEWKREWMEDLTDPEIIFPYFVNYMSRFENTRGKKKSLYLNHDGTGQYVWKKDELVNLTFGQVLDRMVEEFPDLRGVPRRRGYLRPGAGEHGRARRQQGGDLGHQRARVVHHLLGLGEDRRGAGDREHRV